MDIESLGWSEALRQGCAFGAEDGVVPGRVAAIERGAARVWTARGEVLARYGGAFDGVGDWVEIDRSDRVRAIVPRRTSLVRRGAGVGVRQLVAANVDRVLIVTAVGPDFSVRRIERYLAIVHDGGATPVIVVNKADTPHDPDALLGALDGVAARVPVVFASALGPEAELETVLAAHIARGLTLALVGSSGVGKSTLVNRLCADAAQATRAVRAADDKGRHVTTRREMFITRAGVLVIDTPGTRELGLLDGAAGLGMAFGDVEDLARACRFADCAHAGEPECAVGGALAAGCVDPARVESWRRLQREVAYEARRASARERRGSKKGRKDVTRATHKKLGFED